MTESSALPFTCRALLALSAALAGCTAKIALPPSNTTAWLEAPATLGEGKQSVEASASGTGELFGPSIGAVNVRYTRAINADADLSLSPTVQFVDDGGRGPGEGVIDGYRSGDRFAFGADAQVKTNPFATKHVALFGSIGGASGRYATYASSSAGFSLGYDNPYFVPFVVLLAFASVPLVTEAFTYRSEPRATAKVLEASTTYGGLASAGVAVKLGDNLTLKYAMNVGRARSESDTFSLLGGAAAVGWTF